MAFKVTRNLFYICGNLFVTLFGSLKIDKIKLFINFQYSHFLTKFPLKTIIQFVILVQYLSPIISDNIYLRVCRQYQSFTQKVRNSPNTSILY